VHEPRLQQPNNQQQKIAPLTLETGDQPARVGVSAASRAIQWAWPPTVNRG
jgi:hypothetical protein